MKRVLPSALVGWFISYAEKLERPRLFKWICALFLINLFIIDPVPFVDEILLGLFTVFLARRKADPERAREKVVRGETVKDGRDDKSHR